MPAEMQPTEQVYVVRTWRPNGAPQEVWRGRVEHVSSKQRRFFTSLVELCEFISACEKANDKDGA